MNLFFDATINLFQPVNFLMLVGGVFIGLLAGATPGISGTMMVILLLPVTYFLQPDAAFLLLTAVYCAAVFSGSISAILFRTPGAPEAVATTLDGYEMTKKGKAAEALGISIFSSAVGGLIGTLILIFAAPHLAGFALRFGPAEYFALAIVGISVVAALGSHSMIKAFMAGLLGLWLATIGIDVMSGYPRFTFGLGVLMGGVELVAVLIGLFAISEVLRRVMEDNTIREKVGRVTSTLPKLPMMRRLAGTIARSSLIGTFIGILPGIGATTAALVSYSEAVRWSKQPEKFGTGLEEGVSAPETANNAAANGAMVPLLALGIPGSATTAVMLGAFILHGIQPGPLLFMQQPLLVYTLFVGLFLSNFLILIMAKPFIMGFANIIRIPYSVLGPLILLLCILGVFGIRNNLMDVWIALFFGLVGYVLEKYSFPVAPIILGLVLGGMAEQELRRALVMSGGSGQIFLDSPIALTLLATGVILTLYPIIGRLLKSLKKKKGRAAGN